MSYTPKTWTTGEIVATVYMNNIEQGIAGAYSSATTEAAGRIKIAAAADVLAGTGTDTACCPADTVSAINAKIETHNTSSDAHQNQFSSLETEIATNQTNIKTLQNDLGDLGNEVNSVSGEVSRISTTGVFFLKMTQEEYDALTQKSQSTLYIVDDSKVYLGTILLTPATQEEV